MKVSFFQRIALWSLLVASVVLTGCASVAKVDPTRTSMMTASSVSPGADGMTTSEAKKCTFKKQISLEKAKAYEKDPALIVQENACKEFDQLTVQGSPALAGELTKVGVGAGVNGVANYVVQSALQRKQGKICTNGGCIDTINNNVAFGGEGGQGGQGGRGGNAGALAVSGSSSNSSANVTGGGTCSTCKFKPN
ncbi:hypothetical protein A3I99_02195 [Candidatus Kaiserbacteria bacterium RIFCSPLOWO2_02_FULL_45_11b]|uniref:Uncharacterized protein n=1 Tax=Candidatus Kaiserbacteria bacterium RIFCSPLOWO2_12_FULL_45_26 TaxID=1798525 RepID=A0A1F6FHP0_9BACT|nr:MAG: hypothetical protein A2929_03940 [Candidatus Kaiserbacteria bacterium RIFCSPLOWO2_01_FULL_45_25]OGG81873.1 MAG: hypothetical protein A3I99_02195 [Candidatus Kaiserbacteria bacterium RIFCSPLOWO2_02_FULL_45_11b]OGG85377.1 MAG: hypothetical protein A3G90_05000 [Candidatus Kaiserbacteria bacterium RIFCSPLOWO2_12_FULL_45_26]